MRYSKGTIALSQTQDLPLLRQVMYSKYVTQTQLWQFMRHSGYELSRGSFWWRVKRLEDHGFITRHSLPMAHRDPIFAIASSGLVYLVENVGTPYNGPEAGPDIRVDGVGVAHALGVNEVHLDLLRSRALVSWENEMEIRCRNEVADTQVREGLRRNRYTCAGWPPTSVCTRIRAHAQGANGIRPHRVPA